MAFFYPVFLFFVTSFTLWFRNILFTPFSNFEVLWILIPVYLGLVTAEMFQEKKGTSIGNAISNSIIILWGGVDFLRITINGIVTGSGSNFLGKLVIAVLIVSYGLLILYLGLRASGLVKHIGRVRWACYSIIVFAPLYYTNTLFSWKYLAGAIIFSPLFYLAVYLIDKFTPDPKAFVEDLKEATGSDKSQSYSRYGNSGRT
ncbi:MAG TPA: hypothetical protein VI564_03555 [Candidatus Nanoarchaeia archaeon]|nr:hypothetical protein [Candidatus Nanoarchaeia archaeon]